MTHAFRSESLPEHLSSAYNHTRSKIKLTICEIMSPSPGQSAGPRRSQTLKKVSNAYISDSLGSNSQSNVATYGGQFIYWTGNSQPWLEAPNSVQDTKVTCTLPVSYDSSETVLFRTKLLWIVGQVLSCMCLLISFMHIWRM